MKGCLGPLALLVLVVIGISLIGSSGNRNSSVVSEVAATCRAQRADLAAYLRKATELGFYLRGARHQVDEASWAALSHDQKVNLAIAAFCTDMAPDGTGTMLLYGLHDGKVKASMIDGNYSD